MPIRICPSILSADFANLERDLGRISNADLVHVDIMDSHFVPNLTFGLPVVKRLGEVTPVPFDVHLMIDDPDRWAPDYADAGVFSVTFHAEAARDCVGLARRLRAAGARAGLAIKPDTVVDPYLDFLPEFDQLLIMTVEPGFGGQTFMESMMPKLRRAADAIRGAEVDVWLQVDGGISEETIGMAVQAGADTFVAGSSIFSAATVLEVEVDVPTEAEVPRETDASIVVASTETGASPAAASRQIASGERARRSTRRIESDSQPSSRIEALRRAALAHVH